MGKALSAPVPQMVLPLPATDDEIEEAIRLALKAEIRRQGVTKPIGFLFMWMWLLYSVTDMFQPHCQSVINRDDFRRVVRERFQGWRKNAETRGWEPSANDLANPWWKGR